ncbi:WD40 repeat domain-containing protein [Streptomyces sp. NPDC005279]|uniref:WD40 repeat domain-containing protein n=1 Tax=Streptomyces sp. NPDC005279 TaxID=3364712 RepID=UPI00367EB6B5
MGTFEDMLQAQARRLSALKVQAGNPSLRKIEKRAAELFANEKVSLPPATQSALLNGGYSGQDRLMWLVRTLLSWDRCGRECAAPDYGAAELDDWYERWAAITAARPTRRRTPAAPASTSSEDQGAENEAVPAPSILKPAGIEASTSPRLVHRFVKFAALQALTGYESSVNAVAFSPGGTHLATAGNDGTVQLWDPAAREPFGYSPLGHQGSVYAVAFSPDGTLLATAGDDRMVQLWTTRVTAQSGFSAGA